MLTEPPTPYRTSTATRAKLPSFPLGFYGPSSPRVSDPAAYDVRYASFLTTSLLFPNAVYEGLDGQDIRDFYTARSGSGPAPIPTPWLTTEPWT